MVEVGGSNPPGPTKRETLSIGGGFSFVARPDETDDSGSMVRDPRARSTPSAPQGAKPAGVKRAKACFASSAWSYQITNPRSGVGFSFLTRQDGIRLV